jgi:hypothetical protein
MIKTLRSVLLKFGTRNCCISRLSFRKSQLRVTIISRSSDEAASSLFKKYRLTSAKRIIYRPLIKICASGSSEYAQYLS